MSDDVLQSRRILHVSGLADAVTDVTLRAAFIPFGPIKSIDVPRDYTKNTHKGFAFVEYDHADDAAEAVDNMDASELHGKTLQVTLAQPSQFTRMSSGGTNKSFTTAVWSTDEWFQQNSGMETEEQQEQRQLKQRDEVQLKEQVPMP